MKTETLTTNQTMVKMVFDRWNALNQQFDELLNALSDEQLQKEIAPGKNRGIYLLGHLIAVHDNMLQLLDMGDKLYPELHQPFIEMPDKAVSELPDAKTLRSYWSKQKESMDKKFSALSTDDWFEKHTAVSAEDFAREPHRNKLNIVLTRGSHLGYHIGQMKLLK